MLPQEMGKKTSYNLRGGLNRLSNFSVSNAMPKLPPAAIKLELESDSCFSAGRALFSDGQIDRMWTVLGGFVLNKNSFKTGRFARESWNSLVFARLQVNRASGTRLA